MKCQKCKGSTEVIDTQKFSMFVWRKRRCKECGNLASTHENFVEDAQRSRVSDAPKKERKKPEPRAVSKRQKREPVLIPADPTPSARKKIEEILERWRLEEEERANGS